jgi:hypothetical protein
MLDPGNMQERWEGRSSVGGEAQVEWRTKSMERSEEGLITAKQRRDWPQATSFGHLLRSPLLTDADGGVVFDMFS